MKRNEAFPSKYISKEDLPEPRMFTVEDVQMEVFDDDEGQKSKPVMYFADEDSKPFIVNGTNWLTIEGMYGEDSDNWKGKPITLFNDPSVMFGKKRVGGVRVRIPGEIKPMVSKQTGDVITAFWVMVKEKSLDGKEIIARHNGDFQAALNEANSIVVTY